MLEKWWMDSIDQIFDASGGLISDWQNRGEKFSDAALIALCVYALQARPVLVWVSYDKTL